MESDTKRPRNSHIDGDYYLALAYAKEQAGDLAGVRDGIQKYLDSQDIEKSRSMLNFRRILRNLGAAISDEELNRVPSVKWRWRTESSRKSRQLAESSPLI